MTIDLAQPPQGAQAPMKGLSTADTNTERKGLGNNQWLPADKAAHPMIV